MDVFRIKGGRPLRGEIRIGGAKNAVLPVLAAAILCGEKITLRDCPIILDMANMIEIMRTLGCCCEQSGHTVTIDSSCANSFEMPEMLSKKLRSSIFMMGSILSRFGRANVTFPGGCEIGQRPIDLHLKGLRALGVDIREEGDMIYCDGTHMHGGEVYLDFPSVGATENVMMAAVLAPGTTTIHNAAREPEIEDLEGFVNAMGGNVFGAGTHTLTICGVTHLHGCEYTPIPDRIVAGTLLASAAITDGDVTLHNVRARDMEVVLDKLRECGCTLDIAPDAPEISANESIRIRRSSTSLGGFKVSTLPHPGFPTDMQAQMMALACVAAGTSVISETVFEKRMAHARSFASMGANITLGEIGMPTAFVRGVDRLYGASVHASDLRGGAALVMAGLAAQGVTLVGNVNFIDRGYECLEDMLSSLGADIRRADSAEFEDDVHVDAV